MIESSVSWPHPVLPRSRQHVGNLCCRQHALLWLVGTGYRRVGVMALVWLAIQPSGSTGRGHVVASLAGCLANSLLVIQLWYIMEKWRRHRAYVHKNSDVKNETPYIAIVLNTASNNYTMRQ